MTEKCGTNTFPATVTDGWKYVAVSPGGVTIDGIGATAAEARAEAIQAVIGSTDEDALKAYLAEMEAEDYETWECTPALARQVAEEGGYIDWGTLPCGIICTKAEEESNV